MPMIHLLVASVHPFLQNIYIYPHWWKHVILERQVSWCWNWRVAIQFPGCGWHHVSLGTMCTPNKQDERYLQEKAGKYLRQHITLWQCWIVEGNWTSCLFFGLPKMAMWASELLCTWTRAWNSSRSATRKPWWIGVTGFAIGAPSLWSACRGLSSVLQILHFVTSQCCQLTQNHPDYIIFHVEPSRKSIPHVWDLSNWQESFRCFVCLHICTSRVFSRRKPWRLWIVFQLVLFWLLLLVEYDCHREQRIFPTWRCL